MTEPRDDAVERWLRATLPRLAPTSNAAVDAYPAVRGRIQTLRRRRGQQRGALAVAAATAVVLALSVQFPPFGGESVGPIPLRSPVVFSPPLGVVYRNHRDRLVNVDPQTLKPVGSTWAAPPVDLQFSYSPQGNRLALVHGNGSNDEGLTVLNPRTLQAAQTLSTGIRLPVLAIDWTTTGIVEVVGECCLASPDAAVWIDPSTGAVTSSPLHGSLQRTVATTDALYVVVGPTSGIGPSHVVRLTGLGSHVLPLDRIASGLDPPTTHSRRHVTPGLAVNPSTHAAYVLAPGAPVAEADFDAGSVTYHNLAQRHSIGELLDGLLMPPAYGKDDIYGADWTAQWLGNGLIAMAGSTTSPHTFTPTGLRILDVHTWSETTLDKTADQFQVADGTLIALHNAIHGSRASPGGAAVGYDSHGQQTFTVGTPLDPVWRVDVVGTQAFAYHYCGSCAYDVLDTTTGRVLAVRHGYGTLATPLVGRTSEGDSP
jgi:hypothetical protein